MKRIALAAALLASVTAFAPLVLAYSSPGAPTGFVNDFAKVLNADAKQSLETELTNFEKQTSNEITIAIVPNMGGDYIENYAVKLFEEWGVGKKDRDNGVLLLLSIEERQMRIEVGYGLEGALPDSIAQSILNNDMTPLLKAGDYDGAVTAGVLAIEQATKGEYTASRQTENAPMEFNMNFLIFILFAFQFLAAILARSRSWWAGGVIGFLGASGVSWLFALSTIFALPLVVVLTLLGLFFDYVVSKGYHDAKARGITPPWWVGGPGRGGSSGGGFGGFGGGMSGGGGASGRW